MALMDKHKVKRQRLDRICEGKEPCFATHSNTRTQTLTSYRHARTHTLTIHRLRILHLVFFYNRHLNIKISQFILSGYRHMVMSILT